MNLSLPPFFALIPYGLVLAVLAVFSLINVSHLLRHGGHFAAGLFFSALYLAGALMIVYFTWQLLPIVDWNAPLNLGIPTFTL
jgi:hypothetical protein